MEAELLRARLCDALKADAPKFLGFLSLSEAALLKEWLSNFRCEYSFFGGYDSAERVILGIFPEWAEKKFPITAITFKFRTGDLLSHRDFLGSLMALGIKRETVGDILIEEGRAVAFVSLEIKDYILTQISKIGRVGVTVSEGYIEPLPEREKMESLRETVSSARLDCVVSALCGFSRAKSAEAIASGIVSVNSVVSEKATKTVCSGEVIAVRGKGRFIIDSLDTRTKKNRIVIEYRR